MDNKEKKREYYRQYRLKNKDRIKRVQKKYRDSHKDVYKEHRKKNKEKMQAYNKQYKLEVRINAPEKYLLNKARRGAKVRGLEFNLTIDDIFIPDVCPVLNIPFKFDNGHDCWSSPTIDRIDSNKGYIKGNVRVISFRANSLKSNGTLKEFELLVEWLRNLDNGQ